MIIRIFIEINFNMAHVTTGLLTSLMVYILVMQGNISQTSPVGSKMNKISDSEENFECHTDNDCTGTNSFCDSSLHLCSQCLNCNVYFRTPKTNIKCPRDVSDCSTCLDGYLEEKFFGGEIRDACIPIDSNILPTPAKISSNSYWEEYGIIFIFVNVSVFSLFSLLWTYFYKRMRSMNSIITSNSLQDDPENQLPSYDSCMKLDNFVTDDVHEFHLFTGEQPPRNEWRHQNAVPFRLPLPEETNNFSDEDENNEVDGVNPRVLEVEDPELHDEETMPSTWSPLPLLQSPENSRINFQNNNLENCQSPFKHSRLAQESNNEKNHQNEDNTSNMSESHNEETMQSSRIPVPPPQSSVNSRMNYQDNNLENCQPPSKRMRLAQQSNNEKNNQDEDNTSDMSEDMSQDDF